MRINNPGLKSFVLLLGLAGLGSAMSCGLQVRTLSPGGPGGNISELYDPWKTLPSEGPFTGATNLPLSGLLHDVNPTEDPTKRPLFAYEEFTVNSPETRPGHRLVPDITKDDDGTDPGSPQGSQRAIRPSLACGNSQNSVAARIADCLVRNPGTAGWDGSARGGMSQGKWALVTKTLDGQSVGYEVWKDLRTGMLWSDSLGSANWCRAAGNAQANDPHNICNNAAYQNQTNPMSLCAEGRDSAGRSLDTPSAYDVMKGGMRSVATPTAPAIIWRLPTSHDVTQTYLDGYGLVVRNTNFEHWTGMMNTMARRNFAETFYHNVNIRLYSQTRDTGTIRVICTGYEAGETL